MRIAFTCFGSMLWTLGLSADSTDSVSRLSNSSTENIVN